MFEIHNTSSFNKDVLTDGDEYDYVTRTSQNQGILQTTGFVNKENINLASNWSLGLLQMDFFYRQKPWYAGQFVRKITSKIDLPSKAIPYISTTLNKFKPMLLQILVRDVDEVFKNLTIKFPTKNSEIDFDFMEKFITQLEHERLQKLDAYLSATGLKNYQLTEAEQQALVDFETSDINWSDFKYKKIFNNIKQGRRLTKDDQLKGNIPFIMAGTTNTGVVNYISNPVATFPENSITVDIFGNAFYRNYSFGAGDDTGVYWNNEKEYSKENMLFFTTSMQKSILGKFDYGNKLRSSQSLDFEMKVPTKNNQPDYEYMHNLISAIQKQVIQGVVNYSEAKQTQEIG